MSVVVQKIVETLPEGVFIIDTNWRITAFNQTAEQWNVSSVSPVPAPASGTVRGADGAAVSMPGRQVDLEVPRRYSYCLLYP